MDDKVSRKKKKKSWDRRQNYVELRKERRRTENKEGTTRKNRMNKQENTT